MEAVIERWIPVILISLLFFRVIQIVLGNLFRSAFRTRVLLIGGVLIAVGILPIPLVRDFLVGTIVVLFGVVYQAYLIVVGGLLGVA